MQLASYIRAIDYVPLSPPIDSHYPVNSSIALSLSALLPLLPLSTSNKHYPETGQAECEYVRESRAFQSGSSFGNRR